VGFLIVVVSAVSVGGERVVGKAGAHAAVEAVTDEEASEAAEPVEEVMERQQDREDYYLPYPGILPDHPFYVLKMVRDQVGLWLARGETRVERLVLYADKRVGAARALVEGNKADLGANTLLKAEQYLVRAQGMLSEVESEELKDKVYRSALKHREVLEGIQGRLGDESNAAVSEAYELNKLILDKTRETEE
jgi:hypothetical protein